MDTNSGLLIGIDIQENYSQACYFDQTNKMPQNILFADNRYELDNPVVLSSWVDIFSQGVFSKAEELAGHIALLIEQTKRASKVFTVDKICITTQYFQSDLLDVIAAIMEKLDYTQEQWLVISHEECYAYYAYSQKRELYNFGVMLLDYEADGIHAHMMSNGRKNGTELIMESSCRLDNENIRAVYTKEKELKEIEQELIVWLKEILTERILSSVYLTGKGFDVDTFPEALTKYLCTRRKVFAGQNLFVKGACICAYEEMNSAAFDSVLLACHNRVTTGIEVDILERAVSKRLRIVRPGTNWYMARRRLDFILEDVRRIRLIMRPCDGSGDYEEWIDISEIPYRPGKMTRISMDFQFASDDRCLVTVQDKGFGVFVKSSSKTVCREISL